MSPLPTVPGGFKAVLADPPWAFKTWTSDARIASRGSATPYETMSMTEIAAMPIRSVVASEAALFLWVVWPTLPDALRIIEAWGFVYKTCAFSWMKADPYKLFALEEDVYMGLGYWTRANSEVCLLGTRGHVRRKDNSIRQGIIEPKRSHSRKPDCIYERIEQLVEGPYLELFARSTRPGWTAWGNEVGKFGEVA